MRRRRFLATLPLAAGMAGCTGDTSSGTSDPSSGTTVPATGAGRSTNTVPATEATSPGATGAVTVRLRSAYRYVVNVDGIGVLAPERDQFAFVRPPSTGDDPPPHAFTFELGDHRLEPASTVPGFAPLTPGVESVYTDEDRSGSLMFDVPTVDTDSAALIQDGRRYSLPEGDHERLATAPEFRLESVTVPESAGTDERIELGVTVTNEGASLGTYLAGFRHSGFPRTIDVPADPGETRSEAVEYETHPNGGTMRFDFDYPGGDRDYEVAIVDGTATGTRTETPTQSPSASASGGDST